MTNHTYNARVLHFNARSELEQAIAALEEAPEAVQRVTDKAWGVIIHLDGVHPQMAMILKQELLANAGDALISPGAYLGLRATPTPVLAWGSARAWASIYPKFQAFPLAEFQQLGAEIQAVLAAVDQRERGALQVGATTWRWGERTLVMAILNITPDSFSQDGLLGDQLSASVAARAQLVAAAGADILDIGGESTRPGASPVEAAEELRRVLPAIAAARSVCQVPISIDTSKAEVAQAALAAGAAIVNDIWGLRTPEGGWNENLARVVADQQAPLILMHNRRAQAATTALGGHFTDIEYADLIGEVIAGLRLSIDYAESMGISRQRIIVDPGVGFGKTPAQNIELLGRLGELRSIGLPVLVGTSRKSFIGLALGAAPPDRLFGTAATVAHAIMQGADIVRVHDVAAMVDVAKMTDALVRPGAWARLVASKS